MNLDTDLIQYLPRWFRQIAEFQEICQTETEQFEGLATAINRVADNFFFQTMGESSIVLWEQVFGIVPNPVTESLDFRRVRLLNRISTRPPFTLGFLYQKLDELIGVGQWTVTVDYPNYTLYIESSAVDQQYATEVAYTIGKIKPAHIVYRNTPYVRAGIFLAEQIELSQLVYNYKLGAWGLGILPFASEDPQGVVKSLMTPSIQDELLTGVAGFVSGDIAVARVNGSVIISALTKTVTDTTLTVTYTVAPDQADAVTLLELLDASGNVLTQSTVYVPVTASTMFKHTIPVAEGVNVNGS